MSLKASREAWRFYKLIPLKVLFLWAFIWPLEPPPKSVCKRLPIFWEQFKIFDLIVKFVIAIGPYYITKLIKNLDKKWFLLNYFSGTGVDDALEKN